MTDWDTLLAPQVRARLKELNVDDAALRQIGAVKAFLLLKASGLTLTRAVLWRLHALEKNLPLEGVTPAFQAALLRALKAHAPVRAFPAQEVMEGFMQAALSEARAAFAANEVPVGAVIVREGVIIARAHNQTRAQKSVLAHAEMLAIAQASARMNSLYLHDCTLYVTLEPCAMCMGAIVQARTHRLVYGANEPRTGAAGSVVNLLSGSLNAHTDVRSGVHDSAARALLQEFFRAQRTGAHCPP